MGKRPSWEKNDGEKTLPGLDLAGRRPSEEKLSGKDRRGKDRREKDRSPNKTRFMETSIWQHL